MPETRDTKSYPVAEAVRAQAALRELAGLGPEMFPVQAFIGMISDEIELLRCQGHTDADIAQTIQSHSNITLTADDIAEHYATPEQRHGQHP